MANTSKKNFNLTRVISEYYMMKKVLGNEYSAAILNGEIEAAGYSGAADRKTLLQMKSYVEQFGNMKISVNGLAKSETFDKFMDRLMQKFIENENTKAQKDRVEFSDNPFDEKFTNLVSGVLEMENAKSKIETSIQVNPQISESISALPVLLGGKKQSSYIKLLSQCTDLFANISGLQNQIAELKESGKGKDAQIESLTNELKEQVKKVAEYKQLVDKALEGAGKSNEDSKVLIALLNQTGATLNVLNRNTSVQGRATRLHATREADRVIRGVENSMGEKSKVEKQLLEHENLYPNYFACMSGKELSVKKGLPDAYNEIKRAAASVGVKPDSQAVENIYIELNKKNLINRDKPVPKSDKSGGRFKKVASILIALALGAGAGYGIAKIVESNQPTTTSSYEQEYTQYMENENWQKNDYMEKLGLAVDGNTLISFDDIENSPTSFQVTVTASQDQSANGETVVWTLESLNELRDTYAADDNIAEYGWSSTGEIDAETSAAVAEVRAVYYENNYSSLLSQVSTLNAQIDKLNEELSKALNDLSSANADKEVLQSQIDSLQSQVDDLQAIIDAADEKYDADTSELQAKIDELQEKLDSANEQINDLTEENTQLKEENAQLKEQVASLSNQILDLNDTIANLKYQNSILSTEKASLISKVSVLEAQIQTLQDRIDELENSSDLGEKEELQEQVNELTAKLAEANETIKELKTENEELTQQIVDLNSSISDLNSDIAELENSVSSLTSENQSLKEECSSLQTSLSNAMTDYNELLEMYNELLNSGGNQEEIESLRNELNSAYNLINAYESKIVSLYNGLTKSSSTSTEAMQDLENLLKMFGIEYNEQGNSSYGSSNEYQPGA